MGLKWYHIAAGLALGAAVIVGGSYIGAKIAQPTAQSKRAEDVSGIAQSDSFDLALAERRLALYDFDGNGTRELVYFPRRGPPAIFEQVGGDYTAENEISRELYRRALKVSGILASDYSPATKKALLLELEGEIPSYLHPLTAYAVLQDPDLVLLNQDKLISAASATSLLAELYQAGKVTDLLKDPKTAVAASLVMFGTKVLQYGNPAYTKMPSYTHWTKSGPEWSDVGTVDESGLVKVAPGRWVHISDQSVIRQYRDLRNDSDVMWGPCGFVRLEHPVGETRDDYLRRLGHDEARRAEAQERGREFDHSMQQFHRDAGKALQEWDRKSRELFHKR